MITLEKLLTGLKLESVNEIVASNGGVPGVTSHSLIKTKKAKRKEKRAARKAKKAL
jgi:hypothetical protein